MRSITQLAAFAALLAACPTSYGRDDAGAVGDASPADIDARLPLCPGRANWVQHAERLTSDRSLVPGVAIQDLLLADGVLWVLAYFTWTTDAGTGGIRRLASIGPDGTLLSDRVVTRREIAWSGAGALAVVGEEVWVIALEGPRDDRSVHLVRSLADGSIDDRELLPEERHEYGGAHALPSSAPGTARVSLAVDGHLEQWVVTRDGGVLRGAAGPAVGADVRLVGGPDAASRRCIAARSLQSGDTAYGTIASSGPQDPLRPLGTRAPFVSQPVELEGRCSLAFYEANDAQPTLGAVRTSHLETRVEGWLGTAPVGWSLVPPATEDTQAGLVLATLDLDVAEQVNLFWVRLEGEQRCEVGEPVARFPGRVRGAPLGAVGAVRHAGGVRVVLGGLTAPGEVAWGDLIEAP
jgi:hypothetical protein